MKDVVFRRCPFGDDVAELMIRSIKGAPLLLGARGRPPVDIKALAHMLARLSAFATAAGSSSHRSISTRCSPCRRDKVLSPRTQ